MIRPTPALVTQRAAQSLPRWALVLLGLAYVVPGLFGRDPWRSAELTAFGVMAAMAEGRSSWLDPTLGGMPVDASYPAHWLGAVFIMLLQPLGIEAPLAARIPFLGLLLLSLALTWAATRHLAGTQAAQPVAFAFGGEADPQDYARAVADASVLAFVSALGLLQLGHEPTPELMQLASLSGVMWGVAACDTETLRARVAVLLGLPLLAASGAPTLAAVSGVLCSFIVWRSADARARSLLPWLLLATVLALLVATLADTWRWRVKLPKEIETAWQYPRLLVWFLWPLWPLALWTLWQWRRQWSRRHVALPLLLGLSALVASFVMGSSDQALLLGLPALAMLSAFALPTLQRGASAAIDWFSVSAFTVCAITVWVIYLSMQTGVPAQPAINVARLAEGYQAPFSSLPLLAALAGSTAWLWLVRWRTARHQHALWKSLVLPAGGVVLNWLLLLTLCGHLLNHAQSLTPWVDRLKPHVAPGSCIAAPGMASAYVAALEFHGRWQVDAHAHAADGPCETLILVQSRHKLPEPEAPWTAQATIKRPTDRREQTMVFRRAAAAQPAAPT